MVNHSDKRPGIDCLCRFHPRNALCNSRFTARAKCRFPRRLRLRFQQFE